MHTTCHACFCFCIFIHIMTSSRSLHTVSHVAAGIGVNCRGRSCCRFQTGSVGEERALASFQKTPPHILSHSFSTQNNIQQSGIPNIKNVRSLADVFLFSISCLFFLEFLEHWFLHVQMQHIELINSHVCMHKLNF